MTEGKSINLLKAAKELNIGIGTAVEFLGKKGFDVESKPTTKLSADMYNVLSREFQGDKIAKDEAKQIVIGKIRREESPVGGNAGLPQSQETSKNQKIVENDEILIKNVPLTPEKVEAVAEKPIVEESANTGHLKVVGKIDLNTFNKGKAKKVEEIPTKAPEAKPEVLAPKQEMKKEEVKPEPKPEPKVVPVVEVKKEEPKKEEPKKEEKKEPVQTVTIKAGDTVIVNGVGDARSDGKGIGTRNYKNHKMKVIKINAGAKYPYACNQYNTGKVGDSSKVTAWFKASSVKKA